MFAQQNIACTPAHRHRSRTETPAPPGRADGTGRPVGLTVQLDPRAGHLTVHGELDLLTVPLLASELAKLIELDLGEITLDFAHVSFVDARGLGCLAGFADQLAGRGARLTLAGVSPRVRRVFEIVQLGRLLKPS